MKRLLGLVSIIIIIYAIYYDLNEGTLPSLKKQNTLEVTAVTSSSIPYFESAAKNGDTVLSIIEQNINGPIPVSIDQVINDFKTLNNGLQPESIQKGETYRFPDYSE